MVKRKRNCGRKEKRLFLRSGRSALVLSRLRRLPLTGDHGFTVIQKKNKKLRPRTHVSGYFWIHNFFIPDMATVHTYPVKLEDESATFRYISENVWTLNPDTFFSHWRHKIEPSSLPWIFKTVREKKNLRIQKCPDTCGRGVSARSFINGTYQRW